jgi:Tfp pilus assembly protein PilF
MLTSLHALGLAAAAVAATAVHAPGAAAPAAEGDAAARQAFAEGLRLEAAGDPELASSAFRRAYAAAPALAHAGLNAAILRERLGDDAGARALYAQLLDRDPAFAAALRNLVRLAIRSGDLPGAEQEARARIDRAPGAVALRNALVDVLLAAGQLDEAEREARSILKADDRDVAALVGLATVYERRTRHELARTILESARAIDDRDPAVWNRLGVLDLAAGDRVRALEDFRTAAALAPDHAEARANHGVLLADAEDFEGAVRELEAASRYAPRSAAVWLNLGNAYRGARRSPEAEAAYLRALALDPALLDADLDLALLYLDGEAPAPSALARLDQATARLDAYERKGGRDARMPELRKDVARAIERERKRLAREDRDRPRRGGDLQRPVPGAERTER